MEQETSGYAVHGSTDTLTPSGLWRRVVFHAVLAMFASPIPGALLVAYRVLSGGKATDVLAVLSIGATGTGLALAAAFGLPISAAAAGTVVTLLAMSTGIGIAALERRHGVAPRTVVQRGGFALRRVIVWTLTVPVAWIVVAWCIALLAGRWGVDLMRKPSLPAEVLRMAAVWLAPTGVLLGLARAALKRPWRLSAPITFAATLPALLVGIVIATASMRALFGALHIATVTVWPAGFGGDAFVVVRAASRLIVTAAMTEYLSDAVGCVSFVRRLGIVAGILSGLGLFGSVVDSSVPAAVRQKLAYQDVERGDERSAARSWNWRFVRGRGAPGSCWVPEQLTMARMLAGDIAGVRRTLEDVRRDSADACPWTSRIANGLLASPLDLGRVVAARGTPIRPETYLGDSWCAVLTAVREARPDWSETALKNRLQLLSKDSDEIQLPRMDGFDDLRLGLRFLDCEPIPYPADSIGALLAVGKPVLFRDPIARRWGVIMLRLPRADAVVWLDYSRWDRKKDRPLSRRDVSNLVSAEEGGEDRRDDVRAEVRRLDAESVLAARLALDGAWVVAVVPRQRDGTVVQPAGGNPVNADTLDVVWEARHALSIDALQLGSRLAATLPDGASRQETLAVAHVASLGAPLEAPPRPLPAEASGAGLKLLGGIGVEALSPWAIDRLESVSRRDPAASCVLRQRVLERWADLNPGDDYPLLTLLDFAVQEGKLADVIRHALRLVRTNPSKNHVILRVMEALAPVARQNAEARVALAEMMRRVPPIFVPDDEGSKAPSPRAWSAPWCAARAALSEENGDAARWWRRAVEIEPKNAPYHRALADALERGGRTEDAAEERRRARWVEGAALCAGEVDILIGLQL